MGSRERERRRKRRPLRSHAVHYRVGVRRDSRSFRAACGKWTHVATRIRSEVSCDRCRDAMQEEG